MTLEATLGTALLSLLGIVLLVGTFYVLAAGKLPLAWRQGRPNERATAPDRGHGYSAGSHKVVLHNDMISVVLFLRRILGLNYRRAYSIMDEAHTKGSAIVLLCSEESADLYRKNLREAGLTVSVEPV